MGYTLKEHEFLRYKDVDYSVGYKSQMNFDLYIPEIETYLEFNGYMHHREEHIKSDKQKVKWCEQHKYRLITIQTEIGLNNSLKAEKLSEYHKVYSINQEKRYDA